MFNYIYGSDQVKVVVWKVQIQGIFYLVSYIFKFGIELMGVGNVLFIDIIGNQFFIVLIDYWVVIVFFGVQVEGFFKMVAF